MAWREFWSPVQEGLSRHLPSPVRESILDRYVQEFAGRNNIRDMDTLDQMAFLARGIVGKRLRYARPDRLITACQAAQGRKMRNRLYRADCKAVIDGLIQEGIRADLIYLDPPFNSNRTYSMLFQQNGVTAQQKAYHDMWDFTDSTRQLVLDFRSELEQWELAEEFKQLHFVVGSTCWSQSSADDKKLLNYLMYMTQRLVLPQEGS